MPLIKLTELPPINIKHVPVTRKQIGSMWDDHLAALVAKRDSTFAQVIADHAMARSFRNAVGDYIRQRPEMSACKGKLNKLQDGTYAIRIEWHDAPTHSYPTAAGQSAVIQQVQDQRRAKAVPAAKSVMAKNAAAWLDAIPINKFERALDLADARIRSNKNAKT